MRSNTIVYGKDRIECHLGPLRATLGLPGCMTGNDLREAWEKKKSYDIKLTSITNKDVSVSFKGCVETDGGGVPLHDGIIWIDDSNPGKTVEDYRAELQKLET